MNTTKIVLYDLPKVSANQFYAGVHWSKRKRMKDTYKLLIRSQTKLKFEKPCSVEYRFTFKNKPLDCSNTNGMLKMIEDCLFDDDSINIVKSISITSLKGSVDKVEIAVNEI